MTDQAAPRWSIGCGIEKVQMRVGECQGQGHPHPLSDGSTRNLPSQVQHPHGAVGFHPPDEMDPTGI